MMQTTKWTGLKYAVSTFLCAILPITAASASEVDAIADNEPRVMRIIFDDCLGFVQNDIAPFAGMMLLPITDKGRDVLHPRYATNDSLFHLFSDRYVVTWGEDEEDRYCILLTSQPSHEPMMLGVERTSFLERLTKRANAVGMTENGMPGPFSPLNTMSWRTPDEDGKTKLRMVVMPSGGSDDQDMVDAGIIIVAAAVDGDED
ncbi:hypothetical protein GCM10009096_27140 [Parasphingorhabdus litoris]|uniref:Secreted protein n=1 Tax=Parasphingorhabdus litoris TaxID=394733 RepID=A0ABP3KQU6_9SPHN|nr:hypothetical protein [Parasphingorhabdus litoris]